MKRLFSFSFLLPYSICFVFFIAYLTISLVKHNHYLSGYDLAVVDQVVWKYSQFKAPITTFHALLCKEDIGLLTFLISLLLFLQKRQKIFLWYMAFSVLYLLAIFFIYYPHFTHDGYRFQNKGGLLSSVNLTNFANTSDKRDV